MSDSIFSRIIRGEIPCHRVYQDEWVLAFLDINPVARGHTLVVTKEPVAMVGELSDAAAAGLGRALPRVCRAVQKVTGAAAYNLVVNNGAGAGQEVPHVHVHVIPRYADGSEGFGVRWSPRKLEAEQGAELARQIARML